MGIADDFACICMALRSYSALTSLNLSGGFWQDGITQAVEHGLAEIFSSSTGLGTRLAALELQGRFKMTYEDSLVNSEQQYLFFHEFVEHVAQQRTNCRYQGGFTHCLIEPNIG